MRPYALAALLVPLPFVAHALDVPPVQYPTLPARAADAAGFVPQGWTLEASVEGDLDQDGRADLVLVLRQQDPRNVIEHDGLGPSPYDSNPRILAVAWSRPSGYVLAAQDHRLIPRPESPVMSDPLEDGGVSIQRGTLKVALFSFSSAGSWSMGTTGFTFRWQDGAFVLIGYDQNSTMRNSGQTESVSVNFSTRKVKRAEGSIEDDRERVHWEPLRGRQRWTLESVGDGWSFDPLGGAG
ncbi:hypothetical protein ABH900_002540 [Stenotrophomonas sp. AN71]|uniref:hypothetical protein n=1 Tax=Stenotrophomonas sp. AN71 TaxID=3156253 RepID=UPI003D22C448